MDNNESSTEMIPAVKVHAEENQGFLTRRTLWIFAVLVVVALLTGGTVAILQAISHNQEVYNSLSKKTASTPAAANPSPVPTRVKTFTNPVRAAVIAREARCWKFRDTGPGASGIVYDSGVCFRKGQKYGLDTFRTQAVRNLWLKMAAKYGVSPKWETATSVIYPSVNPSS